MPSNKLYQLTECPNNGISDDSLHRKRRNGLHLWSKSFPVQLHLSTCEALHLQNSDALKWLWMEFSGESEFCMEAEEI